MVHQADQASITVCECQNAPQSSSFLRIRGNILSFLWLNCLVSISIKPHYFTVVYTVPLPSVDMGWNSSRLEHILGSVLGGALERTQCVWRGANVTRCQNPVPNNVRETGRGASKFFKTFPSVIFRVANRGGGKVHATVCSECGWHRDSSQRCARRWMELLVLQANLLERATYNYSGAPSG